MQAVEKEYGELDTIWFMAASLFKDYPYDVPSEAFTLPLFRQVCPLPPIAVLAIKLIAHSRIASALDVAFEAVASAEADCCTWRTPCLRALSVAKAWRCFVRTKSGRLGTKAPPLNYLCLNLHTKEQRTLEHWQHRSLMGI